MSFSDDIKSKSTNLYPVVIIDKGGENEIRISTNSTTIGGQYYQPILLNIPSLKESVDIEKRNYRIASISLTISDYVESGVKFSETVAETSLINKSVDIYWISPSVTTLDTGTPDTDAKHIYHGWVIKYDIGSDDKIKLSIEDRSQAKFHKKLPDILPATEEIPDKYKNKPIPMVYGRVKRSPLVVYYSPLFVEDTATAGANIIMQIDTYPSVALAGGVSWISAEGQDHPDFFVYDELYIRISKSTDNQFTYGDTVQYQQSDEQSNLIVLGQGGYNLMGGNCNISPSEDYDHTEQSCIAAGGVWTPYITDPISFNKIIAYEEVSPSSWKAYQHYDPGSFNLDRFYLTNSTVYDYSETHGGAGHALISGTLFFEQGYGSYDDAQNSWGTGEGDGWMPPDSATVAYCIDKGIDNDDNTAALRDGQIRKKWNQSAVGATAKVPVYRGSLIEEESGKLFMSVNVHVFNISILPNGSPYPSTQLQMAVGSTAAGNQNYFDAVLVDSSTSTLDWPYYTQILGYTIGNWHGQSAPIDMTNVDAIALWLQPKGGMATGGQMFGVQIKIWDATVKHHMLIKDFNKLQTYADVVGRIYIEGSNITPTAPRVMNHIVANELYNEHTNPFPNYFYTGDPTIKPNVGDMEEGFKNYDLAEYAAWRYDFAHTERMNSKKLIESIASASPFIPRFTNLGEWKYDTIRKNYTGIPVDYTIDTSECIDFSFKRTPISSVATKVVFNYGYDHGADEFLKSYTTDMEQARLDGLISTDYDYDYYGFMAKQDDGSHHGETTMTVDDDRGKFIADDTTAENFGKWLLMYYCNQHLKIKCKMPISWLSLEVGNLIKFDDLLGGVIKPFGIDYRIPQSNILPGNQMMFSHFLIVSTRKTLDYVEFECIQMHKLTDDTNIYDCTDETACNYNPDADINSGGCLYPPDCLDCEGNVDSGATYWNEEQQAHRPCDADGDGILDYIDPCVGEYDACGICNGPGMTEQCCDGTPYCTNDPEYECPSCGCTDETMWNYDPNAGAEFSSSNCESSANYMATGQYVCPVEYHEGTMVGEEELIDYSSNYAGDLLNEDNAFSIATEGINTDEEAISAAYDYYINTYLPCLESGSGGCLPPVIYQASTCQWEDIVEWYPYRLTFQFARSFTQNLNVTSVPVIVEGDGQFQQFDPAYTQETINQQSQLQIPIDQALKSWFTTWGIRFNFTWEFYPSALDIEMEPRFPAHQVKLYWNVRVLEYRSGEWHNKLTTQYAYGENYANFEDPPPPLVDNFTGANPNDYYYYKTNEGVGFNLDASLGGQEFFDQELWNTIGYKIKIQLVYKLEADDVDWAEFERSLDKDNHLEITFVGQGSEEPPEETWCPGDLTGDGDFNVADLTLLAGCVLAENCEEKPYSEDADMDGNGEYNISDIVQLLSCMLDETCGDCNE